MEQWKKTPICNFLLENIQPNFFFENALIEFL